LDPLSDNALMVRVREGTLDHLGLLFERHKRPLYGFFYNMTRDRDLSEDLVQTVFLRILKYRHLFREDGEFKTWMFHIARNVHNDQHRKKRPTVESLDRWTERIAGETNRQEVQQRDDERTMLREAMDRLPDDKKEVLLLSKYQERKYSEIAQLLGCSEGAVKVKVFRALRELKVLYKQVEKHW
jgi:RNA polymerase sigma-70 factor (ECF subfamily)